MYIFGSGSNKLKIKFSQRRFYFLLYFNKYFFHKHTINIYILHLPAYYKIRKLYVIIIHPFFLVFLQIDFLLDHIWGYNAIIYIN